jgi:hypothetical protein
MYCCEGVEQGFEASHFSIKIRHTISDRVTNGDTGKEPKVYLSTNSVGWALVYPIGLPLLMFLIAIFVMPETRQHSAWQEGTIEEART